MRLIRERYVASIAIVEQGRLVGLVTAADAALIPPQDVAEARARQVLSRAVISATPDESLYTAWLRMSRWELRYLPVVDGPLPARPLGLLRRSDVFAAYGQATGTTAERSDARAVVD